MFSPAQHPLPVSSFVLAMLLAAGFAAASGTAQTAVETSVTLEIGPEAARVGAGRLLLFIQMVDPTAKEPPASVDANQFFHNGNTVVAREATGLTNGMRLRFDADDRAHPTRLDHLPPGDYWLQAVLDGDRSYAYSGRGGGDVVSEVARIRVPSSGSRPTLTLDAVEPAPGFWEYPGGHAMFKPEEVVTVNARIKPFTFASAALGTFMGRPVEMRGLVLTPESHDQGDERFPVVYATHGFTAGMTFLCDAAIAVMRQTREGRLPPMIWVFLDESCATGTHEFADSVNNGPWGTALTTELIPHLESRYRTDGAAGSRFVTGHSSGGWAALWLQVKHPKLFGGAWATAPDFTDFTNFWGVDITQPDAVMKEISFEQLEETLGEYGGQMTSFEWVFSPRGTDGRPLPLYDRATRVIDPEVAAHWRKYWDISEIIRNRWAELKPDLDGKVRVIVGEEDEAGLDDAARRLEAAFKAVGGAAAFTYLPGKGHGDLYSEGDERMALRRKIAWEMWRIARPKSPLKDPTATHDQP